MTETQIAVACSAFAIRAQRASRDGSNAFFTEVGIVTTCLLENELEPKPERIYRAAAKLANRRLAERSKL